MKKITVIVAACLMVALPAVAEDEVTVNLTSPDLAVSVGDPINWTITVDVAATGNVGLALISVDLVQDPGNPELIDIPQADAAPAAMFKFVRPDGISNPGPGGNDGYQGTPVGTPGEQNLLQIGGAQNTFGAAGTTMGLIFDPDQNIGHTTQIVATGTIIAPSTEGDYTFSLANIVANVMDTYNAPPAFSPVSAGNIQAGNTSIVVTVSDTVLGDLDGDGCVGFDDLNILLSGYGTSAVGDLDGDMDTDFDDLNILLAAYDPGC